MIKIRTLGMFLLVWLCVTTASAGAEKAEVLGEVTFRDDGGQVTLEVPLSHPVPWKVWLALEPSRIVIEFNDVDWVDAPSSNSVSVVEVVAEQHAVEWSRLVAFLHEPLAVDQAEMVTNENGSAVLNLTLLPVTGATFRDLAKPLEEIEVTAQEALPVVVIDPGHGGRDPGAQAGAINEADMMLDIAILLQDELLATGKFNVILTREGDEFLHLETRVARAREAEADVFLSLHADRLSVEAGQADGLTLYSLSADLAEEAAARQAARHGPEDVLKGANLEGAGDDVAIALMGLQQQDTRPRTEALSGALLAAVRSAGLAVNGRPERQGNFAVLKAADVPSVLIELGFLSSAEDLARLTSIEWRNAMVKALTEGVLQWQQEDEVMREARKK